MAQAAGMSLRFVGQVESGQANVSLARLAELAAALDASLVGWLAGLGPVHDVLDQIAMRLRDRPPEELDAVLASVQSPHAVEKIALVGLRGAGKSTVGARVAQRLGCPFVEVDALVRQRAGLSLADLFEIHGAQGYHRVSREVLRECLVAPGPAVLEIGGSVVADTGAWALLSQQAHVVWLRATAEAHLERVAAQGDTRPMEGYDDALVRLREILAEREPLYQRAHKSFDTVELGLDGVVTAVAAAGGAVD